MGELGLLGAWPHGYIVPWGLNSLTPSIAEDAYFLIIGQVLMLLGEILCTVGFWLFIVSPIRKSGPGLLSRLCCCCLPACAPAANDWGDLILWPQIQTFIVGKCCKETCCKVYPTNHDFNSIQLVCMFSQSPPLIRTYPRLDRTMPAPLTAYAPRGSPSDGIPAVN